MFTITVAPVNDPPSFIAGPDQSVLEDSGPEHGRSGGSGDLARPGRRIRRHPSSSRSRGTDKPGFVRGRSRRHAGLHVDIHLGD